MKGMSASGSRTTSAVVLLPLAWRLKSAPPTALVALLAHLKRPEGRALRAQVLCFHEKELRLGSDQRLCQELSSMMMAKQGG